MNAVVMDNADVGAGCIVGALSFVPAEMRIPPRKVVVGSPARVVKDVTDEMLAWKNDGTRAVSGTPGRACVPDGSPASPCVTCRPTAASSRNRIRPGRTRGADHEARRTTRLASWVTGTGRTTELRHAVTGEPIGEASSGGLDFKAMVEYARAVGGPTLRRMTFHERARMLKAHGAVPHGAEGRVLRGVGGHRRHQAGFLGRHRGRHRHVLRVRAAAAAASSPTRRSTWTAPIEPLSKGGTFVGAPHLRAARGRGRPHQRLQLSRAGACWRSSRRRCWPACRPSSSRRPSRRTSPRRWSAR